VPGVGPACCPLEPCWRWDKKSDAPLCLLLVIGATPWYWFRPLLGALAPLVARCARRSWRSLRSALVALGARCAWRSPRLRVWLAALRTWSLRLGAWAGWMGLRPERLRVWLAAPRPWSLRLGAWGLGCGRNGCAWGSLRSGLGRCGRAHGDSAAAATAARGAALRTWSLRLGAWGLGCGRNRCAWGCAQDLVAAVGRVGARLRPQRLRVGLAALRTWSLRLGAWGLGCGRNGCAWGSLRHEGPRPRSWSNWRVAMAVGASCPPAPVVFTSS